MDIPSFFDIDSVYDMIRYNGAGLNGANNLPLKLIRERATTVGCVEPKIEGYCYGHTNANITNLGNILSLTLTNGILPEDARGMVQERELDVRAEIR